MAIARPIYGLSLSADTRVVPLRGTITHHPKEEETTSTIITSPLPVSSTIAMKATIDIAEIITEIDMLVETATTKGEALLAMETNSRGRSLSPLQGSVNKGKGAEAGVAVHQSDEAIMKANTIGVVFRITTAAPDTRVGTQVKNSQRTAAQLTIKLRLAITRVTRDKTSVCKVGPISRPTPQEVGSVLLLMNPHLSLKDSKPTKLM